MRQRAHERQVLLICDVRQLPAWHVLRRYLDQIGQAPLERALGPRLAGLQLDTLCHRGEKCLVFDLSGFPGTSESFPELERYLMLARFGLWTLVHELALQALLQRL